MKRIFILFVLLFCQGAYAQNIVQVEHYIDTDPGYGSGTQVSITPDSVLELSFNVDLTDIGDGFHLLYVRAMDEFGHWSLTSSKPFFKETISLETSPDVTRLEYFLDSDPGYGSGVNVPVSADSNLTKQFVADLSDVSDGFHMLYVRAMDEFGHWSLTSSKPFFKETISLETSPDVTRLEYFFDTDPGYGSGVNVPVSADSNLTKQFVADLSGVSDGFHLLYVRAMDEFGHWSLTSSKPFFKECPYGFPGLK